MSGPIPTPVTVPHLSLRSPWVRIGERSVVGVLNIPAMRPSIVTFRRFPSFGLRIGLGRTGVSHGVRVYCWVALEASRIRETIRRGSSAATCEWGHVDPQAPSALCASRACRSGKTRCASRRTRSHRCDPRSPMPTGPWSYVASGRWRGRRFQKEDWIMSILEPKQVIVRTWQYQVFRDDL